MAEKEYFRGSQEHSDLNGRIATDVLEYVSKLNQPIKLRELSELSWQGRIRSYEYMKSLILGLEGSIAGMTTELAQSGTFKCKIIYPSQMSQHIVEKYKQKLFRDTGLSQ